MKKKLTKMVAGISSAAILTSFSALAVPAFAAEYEAVEANAYVDSLEDEEVREVAQYLIDNGISLEEAQSMVARYENGRAMIQSEEETVSAKSVDTGVAFYNGSRLAQTQHYGVIINDNPRAAVDAIVRLTWSKDALTYNLEDGYTMHNGYVEDRVTGGDSFFRIVFSTDPRESGDPLAVVSFPFHSVLVTTEAAIYNNVKKVATVVPVDDDGQECTFTFHSYALGDYNHDGIVDDTDYTYLMQFVIFSFDGKFEYKDVKTEVAYQVNRLAADTNLDGVVDLKDAVTMNKWGLY
jgi:hypothetical protein